jgi:two-component system sensor histidine kinase YesM
MKGHVRRKVGGVTLRRLFNSVVFKIIAAFVLFIVPVVFFLFYHNYYAMSVLKSQVTNSYESVLSNFVDGADNLIQESSNYMIRIQQQEMDVNMLDFQGEETSELHLASVRLFNKFSNDLSYMQGVESLMFYSTNSNQLLLAPGSDNFREKKEVILNKFKPQLTTFHEPKDKQLTSEYIQIGDKHYLLRLYYPTSTLLLGVWINLDALLAKMNLGQPALIFQDGKIITYKNLQEEEVKQISSLIGKQYKAFKESIKLLSKESYLFLHHSSSQENLDFVILIPEENILQNLSFFNNMIQYVPVGIFILVVLVFIMMNKTIIKPVIAIISGMKKISIGQLDTQIALKTSSEFQYMIHNFNTMASEINTLKVNVYEEKIRSQQSELKQLQMQINPHFYANSLNIINGLAQLGNASGVQNMTRLLATYFRFVMVNNRSTLPVREEIMHISTYMEIQKFRYPNQIELMLEISEELMNYSLPPLTLQPFVENAIIHGYNRKINPFYIRVYSRPYTPNPQLFFQLVIEDNGAGVSPEKLEELMSHIQTGEGGLHLGMWNVYRRLKLNFGADKVNVQVESSPEGGFIVILTLPQLNTDDAAT